MTDDTYKNLTNPVSVGETVICINKHRLVVKNLMLAVANLIDGNKLDAMKYLQACNTADNSLDAYLDELSGFTPAADDKDGR